MTCSSMSYTPFAFYGLMFSMCLFCLFLRLFCYMVSSLAPSFGGGGTSSDMPWRDKDEDYLHWAYRAMRYAHAKHYPGNRLKQSLSK